jgi:bifunctional UDP-N-acetylglucosamine pyrophosphorylase / glucosamine-1-phosphate N-acetyltransferase
MKPLAVVILAAGKGTRMKSDLAKVLHPVAGSPMLRYSLDLSRSLKPENIVVVIGAQRNLVREKFAAPDIVFAEQIEQLGTGHAVMATAPALKEFRGTVLILCADVPLLTGDTIDRFLQLHGDSASHLSVLTVKLPNPAGYGRVVRAEDGSFLRIVEDKDLGPGEEKIREINTGIYCFDAEFLYSTLPSLSDKNAQREYYLTDLVEKGSARGLKVTACVTKDSREVMGINTRLDLARANQALWDKIRERHLLAGVTLLDPQTAYIDSDVRIGKDTVIYPNCHLLGRTILGEGCVVEPGCKIADSRMGNFVTLKTSSVVTDSAVEDRVEVGPFAHLRPGTVLREGSRIGNFVEIKKSEIGKGTKANHLTYIGDAVIGEEVNVGAGTITCNFDGREKHPTTIEDGVFVGSNTVLIAPVKVGRNAVIGAGSAITREVPPETLAVSRAKQMHKKRTSAKE